MIHYKNTISGGSSIMQPIRIPENTRNVILVMNLIPPSYIFEKYMMGDSMAIEKIGKPGMTSFVIAIVNSDETWNCLPCPSGVASRHGRNGGPDPPSTYVQTPPEIIANPLKSFFLGGSIPFMYIVTVHQQIKMVRTPLFWAGATTAAPWSQPS